MDEEDRGAAREKRNLDRIFVLLVAGHRPAGDDPDRRSKDDVAQPVDVEKHATLAGFQRGHSRRNRLLLVDWESVEFTYADVNRNQEYVAATLFDAIALRRRNFER